MIFAQVLNSIVENIIVLKDGSEMGPFSKGYDELVDLTDIVDQPSIGWVYDGRGFSKPPEIVQREEQKEEQVTQEKERQVRIEELRAINTDKLQDPEMVTVIELLKLVLK